MRIEWVKLKNYRSYFMEETLRTSPITILVGPNGIGKSSVLEALDLFFNKVGFSKGEDGHVENAEDFEITVAFSDLPTNFVLDEGASTNFTDEPYLLNIAGQLVVKKTYKRSQLGPNNPQVSIQCAVPSIDMVEVVGLSNDKLKKRVNDLGIGNQCDLNVNASMRKALYNYYMNNSSPLTEQWVDIQKRQVGVDSIMPHFALFKSDRLNSLKDAEVSEPVKYAIQSAVRDATAEIIQASAKVKAQIQNILDQANATLADSFGELMPSFGATVEDDLVKAFSASLQDKKGIPLEKQGSGIRRLYMFNLLISEARRKAQETNRGNIVYGIEEPETSQHPDFQRKLTDALKKLAENNQVILTTHNPGLLSQFDKGSIRAIRANAPKILDCNLQGTLSAVVQQLGLLPDPLPTAKFRAVLVVEGPTDLIAIQKIRAKHPTFDELLKDIWVVAGGGDTIKDWVRSQHFCEAGVHQFFLVDSDYKPDGSVGATRSNLERVLREHNRPDLQHILPLRRREIEQYVHPEALKRCFTQHGLTLAGLDAVIEKLDDILYPAGDVFSGIGNHRLSLTPFSTLHHQGMQTIQSQLNNCGLRGYSLLNGGHKKLVAEVLFELMTPEEILERFSYPENGEAKCEIAGWIEAINSSLTT